LHFIEAKFVNPKIVTNVPGPGAHDPLDLFTTKQHSSQNWSINRIERNKRPRTVKHPGPQEYTIPSYINEHQKYDFGLRPFIDPHKCRTTTGPGDYDPRTHNGNPKLSIMGRPVDKVLHKVPGPGAYSDMVQLHYDKIPGSKMGNDERKKFFLKARGYTNPGPGSYKDLSFVDKNTAPSFGFGTSTRERNYLGSKNIGRRDTGPGPGSYKIPQMVGRTAPHALPAKYRN